ncbi:hypothetical protein SY83_19610 [Paenibacillus swuensis]|uniref:TIGR03943 family protein n=1 Tax=Paenibacillus swuensis TaxID=1178515 RepID=A0A172TM67_9BACL|nr:TIGR03943 family protein [Paenibacillus swuensis]ANE48128.1 hypothetical protein SY83_19610 [Paenibacillus swuensis]
MRHSHSNSMLIHYGLRASILLGFALLIVFLTRSGDLILYIAPRMQLYVKLSAIAFFVAAVYQVYLILENSSAHSDDCHCEHPPSPSLLKNGITYTLFLLPLLLGYLLPDEAMNSAMVNKKGINLSSAPTTNPPGEGIRIAETGLFPAEDPFTQIYADYAKTIYKHNVIEVKDELYIETLTTLDMFRKPFLGKTISITGFIYRAEGMKANEFAVSRFSVECCSADAAPYGMLADFPKASVLKDNEWVQVEGKLSESKLGEERILKINVTNIRRITAPASPYVYYNYNFGSE